MNRFVIAACAASLFALAACSESSPSGKSSSGIEIREGNVADCAAFGMLGLKVEPGKSGTYTSGALTVTVVASGNSFNFTSNIPIDVVAVKGGPNTAIYEYDPEVKSGTGLTTEGGQYGLSHILFCYDTEHPDSGVDSGPPPDTGTAPDTKPPPDTTPPPCNSEEDPEC